MKLLALAVVVVVAYLFFELQAVGVVVAAFVGFESIAWIVRRLRPKAIAATGYRAGRKGSSRR